MTAYSRHKVADYPYSDYGETDEEDLKRPPFHPNRIIGRAGRLYRKTSAFSLDNEGRYQRAVLLFVPMEKQRAHISQWSTAAKAQLFAGFKTRARMGFTDPTSNWDNIKNLKAPVSFEEYFGSKRGRTKSPRRRKHKRVDMSKLPPLPRRMQQAVEDQTGNAKDVRPAQRVPTSPPATPDADAAQDKSAEGAGQEQETETEFTFDAQDTAKDLSSEVEEGQVADPKEPVQDDLSLESPPKKKQKKSTSTKVSHAAERAAALQDSASRPLARPATTPTQPKIRQPKKSFSVIGHGPSSIIPATDAALEAGPGGRSLAQADIPKRWEESK